MLPRGLVSIVILALTQGCISASTPSQGLPDAELSLVLSNLAKGATHPWEIGTRAQALLELNTPSFSVLTPNAHVPPSKSAPSSLSTVLSIAKSTVANRAQLNNHATGPQPFIPDAAAGDPPSIGVAVLIANWTGQGTSSLNYAQAATDQLNYLFEKVPKTSDGAISHRLSQLQLWSDFVYMVPPFLAYYGVTTSNKAMLQNAYTQIKLYRNYLLDPSAGGLWRHIVMGSGTDPGHWSTGNGWAAAGMLRVLGTIKNSAFASALQSEQSDLASWVNEIHNGMYSHLQSNGLFLNYADSSNAHGTTNFADASSTALLASTVYRLALLTGTTTHIPLAEKSRKALSATNGSGYTHFTSDGWLTPVVNPDDYPQQGSQSPEGQAFVVEMQAAWRDWVNHGSPGA